MDDDPAERRAEPEEIVMRRGRRGFRRVRRPLPAELRDIPLLYRLGFLWPLHPLTLLVAIATGLAIGGGMAAWLSVADVARWGGALERLMRSHRG